MTRKGKNKVGVELVVGDIVGLVTRAGTWSSSRSRGRHRSRRADRQGPDGPRPSWEGWASGMEGETKAC